MGWGAPITHIGSSMYMLEERRKNTAIKIWKGKRNQEIIQTLGSYRYRGMKEEEPSRGSGQ